LIGLLGVSAIIQTWKKLQYHHSGGYRGISELETADGDKVEFGKGILFAFQKGLSCVWDL